MKAFLSVAVAGWKNETESIKEHKVRFGDKPPFGTLQSIHKPPASIQLAPIKHALAVTVGTL